MLLAFDAHYTDIQTRLIGAVFYDWMDAAPAELRRWELGPAAPYEPGQFYRRELPLLLTALKNFDLTTVEAIIVDGYVYLDKEGRLGLGGHLYQQLGERTQVIGIAKSYFRDSDAVPVLRGESKKPLYVTAAGVPAVTAANHLRAMAGAFRMPNILAAVDRATKE